MKTNTWMWIYSILAFVMVVAFATSCNKNDEQTPEIITDINGNIYHSVTIGTQIWMVENLKVTKFNDGTPLSLISDSAEWASLSTPGYCWYDNNESAYKDSYGALYNGYATKTGKLAPTGWHIATDAEWTILTTYLGGENIAGGKLKEKGTIHWAEPNTEATNETGFSALPGGYRYPMGQFVGGGFIGYWWSSSDYYTGSIYKFMSNSDKLVGSNNTNNEFGYSVRCIKNQ